MFRHCVLHIKEIGESLKAISLKETMIKSVLIQKIRYIKNSCDIFDFAKKNSISAKIAYHCYHEILENAEFSNETIECIIQKIGSNYTIFTKFYDIRIHDIPKKSDF